MHVTSLLRFCLCLYLGCVSICLQAQSSSQARIPLLEKVISITRVDERLDVALKEIERQGDFTFSYKSSLIKADKKVSFDFQRKTIREILDLLFGDTIAYKTRGKYIILSKAEVRASVKQSKVKVLSGYVIDDATGQRLKHVSVYDPVTLSSAVTDAYGYFRIEIDNPTDEAIKLAVAKRNYTDTLVAVPGQGRGLLTIPIRINTGKINALVDSVGDRLKRLFSTANGAKPQEVNMENIRDTLYRKTQFSLLPFIGTNGKLSGNVINDYSLNVWGGYSLGVRKLEFGGLFNTVRGDVTGVQVAGMINGVGGKLRGAQLAGLVNATRDSVLGPKVAGMINLNLNSTNTVSVAGLINYTMKGSHGVVVGGIGNFTLGKQHGPHVGGLFNLATGDSGPAQVAGLFNFTVDSIRGIQFAGLFNFAGRGVSGAQVSGIFNVAPRKVKGTQVALLNVAERVEGTQVGLINISKNMKGVPVGFLSIAGNGYHKIELSADEVFYTNIAFRTGVRQFYNIITAGMVPSTLKGQETLWTFGYGVGTAPKLTDGLQLNLDVVSRQLVPGNSVESINLLNRVYAGLDFQLARRFSITAGVTLNGFITDTSNNDPSASEAIAHHLPDAFYERDYSNDLQLKMWWGGKIGLRFL